MRKKIISCGIVFALIAFLLISISIEAKAAYNIYLEEQHEKSAKTIQQQTEIMKARAKTSRKEIKKINAEREEAERIAAEEEAKRQAEEEAKRQAALKAQQQQTVQYNTQYTTSTDTTNNVDYSDPSGLRQAGVIHTNDTKWTWYSQKTLPGQGLDIPGRHVDENGLVCDGDGNVVLGSNVANRGQIVDTPFGKTGKVYDAGPVGTNWYDVYTDW